MLTFAKRTAGLGWLSSWATIPSIPPACRGTAASCGVTGLFAVWTKSASPRPARHLRPPSTLCCRGRRCRRLCSRTPCVWRARSLRATAAAAWPACVAAAWRCWTQVGQTVGGRERSVEGGGAVSWREGGSSGLREGEQGMAWLGLAAAAGVGRSVEGGGG